jgi:DNA-directed RNA polymerase subunit H (RpoH/RPB5)
MSEPLINKVADSGLITFDLTQFLNGKDIVLFDIKQYLFMELILKEKENSAVSKELAKEIYKNVEVFLRKSMTFNITHHEFVPQHIILTPEEEKEVLDKYYTTKGKLPKMSKNDPVAKYYGMKSEQVCKIIRKSPEVGTYIYYRLVR